MPTETKTIAQINEKLKKGQAVVMTAMEFKKEVRGGRKFTVSDVDVVTTGTRAVMSGSSAMLTIPLEAARGRTIRRMWMNGVPCFPVSNPEPGSPLVDTVIYGTAESRDHHGRYGGGHALRNLVEGQAVELEYEDSDGRTGIVHVTLDQMPFARLYNFRNDFQNYTAFANIKNQDSYRLHPSSIFACRPMPTLLGMSVSGSGELNPMENDPHRLVLKSGTRILLNGAPGLIVSYGTRSAPSKKCLFVSADMAGMRAEYMGGFKTSYGVEITNGIAVPFPITSQQILDGLAGCLDEQVPLPVADIGDRIPLFFRNYAEIWAGAKLEVEFDPERCLCCSFQCAAEYYCPMQAISWREKKIDETLCVACGACTANCLGGAFKGKGDAAPRGSMGVMRMLDRDVPIIFRQSNRFRSEQLANSLKDLLEDGGFLLSDSQADLKHKGE